MTAEKRASKNIAFERDPVAGLLNTQTKTLQEDFLALLVISEQTVNC